MRRHTTGLEAQVAARYAARPGTDKMRRFTDFYDGAGSWSRTERIIACVETGSQGTDTRFIVTDLAGRSKALYEKVYCRRGQAEIRVHMPTACPVQAILRLVLTRIPRLAT